MAERRKGVIIMEQGFSGTVAKDRLKYLVLSDRVSCTGETLDMIKQDVVKVISDYIDIDKYNLSLTLEQEKTESRSFAYINIRIPVK